MGALRPCAENPGALRAPGTYILVAHLTEAHSIRVGRWGEFLFSRGYYLYVGSALGGLEGRLSRHLRAAKRPHWHIDALLEWASVSEVWYILLRERLECAWARALARIEGLAPFEVPFGASDCRCPTHLFYTPTAPCLAAFRSALPYGEAICALTAQQAALLFSRGEEPPQNAR